MQDKIIPPLLLACCFLILFGFAEFLFHKRNVRAEWTRKIVHFGTGILALSFPILLHDHWQVLFLCGSFLILLLISLRYHLLRSINGIDRLSYGSILFPIVVYGCFLAHVFSQKGLIMFYLPILILAICDPVAALIGKRYPYGTYQIWNGKKTLSGSVAFFIFAFFITFSAFYFWEVSNKGISHHHNAVILIPVVATISEAVGVKGTDNFTIPASVVFTLYLVL